MNKTLNACIGFGGTFLAFMNLQELNYAAGFLAGLTTSAWMGRQLWLSRKKDTPADEN